MFGSTSAFGHSSTSPFGSQSNFGQTSNANNNPFGPKPFGSTTPFGSQTGGSVFGGTSTGMFGAPQTSSPFSTAPTFGASSSPAFGSSAPSFGATTSAFGSSSTSFGGSSIFGQKPAFGGFGSTTQTSPFGSTHQQSQPAFGSGLFGSTTLFGASSQSAFASSPGFGTSSAPAFGSSSTTGFGASSTPSFGATSTPAFGATASPAFGAGTTFGVSSNPVFGSGGGFGASSTPVFGTSSTSVFGASSTSGFGGASITPTFGASSTPAFGSSPSFGTSSTSSFSFASSPSFGQSTSAFGSTPFGTTTSPFSAQSSPFGGQASTPTFGSTAFGQSGFAGNHGGSRFVAYSATGETESSGGQPGKLESISAMPTYKDKSHEELRWEDYQLGDRGGPLPPGQSSGGVNFGVANAPANPFASSNTFSQTTASPFSSSISTNPFSTKPFGASSTLAFNSSPFTASPASNPFQSTSAFGSTTSSAFTASTAPSLFGSTSTPAFGSTHSLFTSTIGQAASSPFGNFTSTQPSLSFPSTTPSFGQTGSAFGHVTSSFAPSSTPSFTQSSMFSTPSSGFAFSSTQSPISSTNQGLFGQTASAPFQLSQPSQPTGVLGFGNFGQSQAAGASSFAGSSSLFGPNTYGQLCTTQSNVAVQPVPVTNPFGTLPVMPQMSIGRAGTTPSVQYGISNLPVVDKPASVRISHLLTSRHLWQRQIKLPARKYNPRHDGPKVPFFSDEEETTGTPKADALFIPQENPRALVIRPTEKWPSRPSSEKASPLEDVSTPSYENGKTSEAVNVPSSSGFGAGGRDKNMIDNGVGKEGVHFELGEKPNGVRDGDSTLEGELYMTLSGHRAGEAAITYEHGADIEALMPKLWRSDCYTEPRIQELAAKERAEPGFCRHVKDFVVGRHGYGSIKFLGETDVRRLDLESLVQFNNREVIVYTDDSKKPPIGQGLNKPAEVTLLNIKCFDKKTGRQYAEGPKIEKYKEMLKRKARDQGAEFVSYDPVKGEWKFRVNHFSSYRLGDEDGD